MDHVSLATVAEIVEGELVGITDDTIEVEGVSIHSSRIQSASLFVALPGKHTDGHRFVADAGRNGAVASVVARARLDELSGADPLGGLGPLVVVDDPLAALQRLAAWWRTQLTGTVVAVIGSHGKTVTKDAIVALAGRELAVFGSPGSYNSQLGVALAVLECPREARLVVIEAAATEPPEMARLQTMIRPHHVVFTNLHPRHEQAFGGPVEHARALLSIAAQLPPAGWILLGEPGRAVSQAAAELAAQTGATVIVNGAADDLPAFRIQGRHGQELMLEIAFDPGDRREALIRTPSEDILADLTLAVTVAYLIGVDRQAIMLALDEYRPTSTRTEIWLSPWGYTVIGDIATADPLTFASAVRAAHRSQAASGGRLYVVLADPLTTVDDASAHTLGTAVAATAASAVIGVDSPTLRAVLARVADLDPTIETHLASSTEHISAALAGQIQARDVVLVQVPHSTVALDSWVQAIEPVRATRLYVDLAAIESNVAAFRRVIGPRTRLMGVVKAQAYGTNPVQVALCLQEAGADWLGVATADEGVALRRQGIVNIPILVFLPEPGDIEPIVARGLTPLVYSPEILDAVIAHASRARRPVAIHLEVDSGMHRTGFEPGEAIEALQRIRHEPLLRLEGLMTHLSCPDDPAEDALTIEQLNRFGKVRSAVEELGFRDVIAHAAASAATIRFPQARFDLVRIGLGLYGSHVSEATRPGLSLTPAISLVSRVIEVHTINKGERVGYGGRYTAPGDSQRIAVVPAGYFDAVPRAFSRQRFVWVDGQRAPIVGAVSMDSMTIDISLIPTADVGSDVVLYGDYSGVSNPIEDAAVNIGTVVHEVLTRVGPRVQRIFTRH